MGAVRPQTGSFVSEMVQALKITRDQFVELGLRRRNRAARSFNHPIRINWIQLAMKMIIYYTHLDTVNINKQLHKMNVTWRLLAYFGFRVVKKAFVPFFCQGEAGLPPAQSRWRKYSEYRGEGQCRAEIFSYVMELGKQHSCYTKKG